MGFKRVEKNRRSRRNQSRRDGTICSPARECREGFQANRVPKGRHNGEFSHYRLFSPCHRTSHAKCPSAGNSKHFTDATQISCLIISNPTRTATLTSSFCSTSNRTVVIVSPYLPGTSFPGSLLDNRLKCFLEFSKYRSSRTRRAKVHAAELCHEGLPHSFAAFFKKLRTDGQFLGCRSVPASPCPHVGQQGNELYRGFCKAVDGLLLVSRVVRSRQQTGTYQAREPVGQNV